MANSICLLFLDFNFISSIPLLRGTACPPFLKDALPFCPFGTFPHTVGNHPPRRAEPARPQLPAARIFKTHFKISLENFFQNGIGIRCHCFRFNQIRCNGIRFTIQFSPNFLDPFKSVQQFCLMRNDKIAVLHDLPDFCSSTLRHRQRICSFRESCFCKCIRILFLLSSFDCGRMKGWKEKVRKI